LDHHNNNPGDLVLPAVYKGDYEEKHEGAYGEKHERRWKLAARPVSERMFPSSPVLVAGNNWEMIHKLARRQVQLIESSIGRKHSFILA
jgi:hypothetical protein